MKNMKVSAKIGLGFGAVLVLTLAVVVAVFTTNITLNNALNDIHTLNRFQDTAGDFDNAFNNARIASAIMMFDMSVEEYNNAVEGYNTASVYLTRMREMARGNPLLNDHVNAIDRLLTDLSTWRRLIDDVENANRDVVEQRQRYRVLEADISNSAANITDMQVQSFADDVHSGRSYEDLMRRQQRLAVAVNISDTLKVLTADIGDAFFTMDLSELPRFRSEAEQFSVVINNYIRESALRTNAGAGGEVRDAFNEVMEMLEAFVDTIEIRDNAIATTRAHAARLLTDVNALLASVSQFVDEAVTASEQAGNMSERLSLIVGGVALFVGVIVAVGIVRSISTPVNRLVKLVNDVSAGNLNVNRDKSSISKDEIGMLTGDVYNLVDTIKAMIDDLAKMSHMTNKMGDIEYRIDTSGYQGSYNEMLTSINELVNVFVNDTLMVLGVLGNINKGDFTASIQKQPGKKIVMNNTVDDLMSNLKAVMSDINIMVEAASVDGDLSVQADESKYDGEWRAIVKGLNNIAGAVNAPIGEIRDVMNRLGEDGYLDKRIEGNYAGDFRAIKNTVNRTMDNLTDVIRDVSDTLAAVSSGNLTNYISEEYPGDFAPIRESLNNINNTLHKTMSEISAASDQVLDGAKQISTSATDLANGASEQASSVQELNASIDLINQQTKRNVDNADEANVLSNKSAENAQKGNEAMKLMLEAMQQIKESSNNISKIIKVIQDIAFQTNMLALNASVEAARAGEHGRGFTVVAEEVRSLAGRSQDAANEITGMIENSINRVDAGSGIAEETAKAFEVIVSNANEVLRIIGGISISSKEQAEAVAQLSLGIGQISSVVQSNAAVSEESAASAEELNSQAQLLQQQVSYFKL